MDGQYPEAEWRLLKTGARDGATNMAIDEAILDAVTAGQSPPTLRFFGWTPPCLSLGYSQPAGDVDRAACAQRGWAIVRRQTGGQAILHVDELTYSVCAPLDEPRVVGGIVESYGRLAAGLLALSFWPLSTSRQVLRSITMPVLLMAAAGLYWQAIFPPGGTHRRRYFVLAGFLLGLCFFCEGCRDPTGIQRPVNGVGDSAIYRM